MRTLLTTVICFLLFKNTSAQQVDSSLKISHLSGDFYIFTTYNYYKGNKIPANGMYIVSNAGAILIDSPWDTTQFQPLLDSIEARHHTKVVLCIATHFHEDRTGGLAYYSQHGISTYTTKHTDELSSKRGMKRATHLLDKDSVFNVGQYSFQTYFPGHGHTADNIVIWFEKEKILYGGCLIKSFADDNLGNLADASTKDYATTISNVMQKCRSPRFVIPGHNDWTSTSSLKHTYKMAKDLQKRKQE